MHDFAPIKQSHATEEVFDQLKYAILRGDLRKGDKLPSEKELMKLFDVSRGVIREAIRGLQVSGFIEIKQGPLGGHFVKDNSGSLLESSLSTLFISNKLTISEVSGVRQFIEPQIARLASLNVNEAYRKKLECALAQESQPFFSIDERIQKLTAIHVILAEMCDNGVLKNMLLVLISLTHQIIKGLSAEEAYALHPAGEHDNIVVSVLRGDSNAAEQSMALHSNCFGDAFIQSGNLDRQSVRN
jgi:DNA-binding FadR family transcriptional regulator